MKREAKGFGAGNEGSKLLDRSAGQEVKRAEVLKQCLCFLLAANDQTQVFNRV